MAAIKSGGDGTLSLAPSFLLSASPHAQPAAPCPIVSLWRLFICICTGTYPAAGPLLVLRPRWWQGWRMRCPRHPSIHLARPAPWENFEPSFYHAYHEITASSPPRPPSSTYLTLSFSPASALAVSHMLISHSCTHSLQPYSAPSASELLCSPWMHRLLCSYHHLMMQHCAHLLTAVWDVCTKNISSFLYATGTLIQYQPKVKSGCLIGYWHKWSESKWVIDRTVKRKWSRSLTEWIPNRNYGWKWARVHAGKQI